MTEWTRHSSRAHKAPWQQMCVCVCQRPRHTHTGCQTITYITKDCSCLRSQGLLGQRFLGGKMGFSFYPKRLVGFTQQHIHTPTHRHAHRHYMIGSLSKNRTAQFFSNKKQTREGFKIKHQQMCCEKGNCEDKTSNNQLTCWCLQGVMCTVSKLQKFSWCWWGCRGMDILLSCYPVKCWWHILLWTKFYWIKIFVSVFLYIFLNFFLDFFPFFGWFSCSKIFGKKYI